MLLKQRPYLQAFAEVLILSAWKPDSHIFMPLFQERLGVLLEKEDEMDCAVSGCNFLLKAVRHEAFSYENGKAEFSSVGDGALSFSQIALHRCGLV